MSKRGHVLKGRVKRSRAREKTWLGRWRQKVGALDLRRKRTAGLLKSYRRAPKGRKPRLLKLYRASRTLAVKVRASAVEAGDSYRTARGNRVRWGRALAAYRKAIRRPYPHLSGDLDSDARVLRKLENLAKGIGRNIYVTSGNRTPAEQKVLYDARHSNPYPVAFSDGVTCHSNHCGGDAADCTIGGVVIQHVVSASTLRAHGLEPLLGDAVHVVG